MALQITPNPITVYADTISQKLVTAIGADVVQYANSSTSGTLSNGQTLKLTIPTSFHTLKDRGDGIPGAMRLDVTDVPFLDQPIKLVTHTPSDTDFNDVPPSGALAINESAQTPYFKNSSGQWKSMGGGGGSVTAGVFDVVGTYGADPTGVNDSFDAFQAAATAASFSGGIVSIPAGTFLLSKVAPQLGVEVPYNMTDLVTFRGAGRDTTTIKLTNNCPTFIQSTGGQAGPSPGDTWRNVTIEDLTVDAQNQSGAVTRNNGGIILNAVGNDINQANVTVRRVRMINGGPLNASGNNRRCILAQSLRTVAFSSTQYTVTDMTFEDLELGLTGGGGTTGILCSTTLTTAAKNTILGDRDYWRKTVPASNVFYDRITSRRVRWRAMLFTSHNMTSTASGGTVALLVNGQTATVNFNDSAATIQTAIQALSSVVGCTVTGGPLGSGTVSFAFATTTPTPFSFAVDNTNATGGTATLSAVNPPGGSGIQYNGWGQGGQQVIEDCYLSNSGDVGIEVDQPLDLIVANTIIENAWFEAVLISNNHGGLPQPEKQTCRVVDSTVYRSASNFQAMQGFGTNSSHMTGQGHFVYENCWYKQICQSLVTAPSGTPFEMRSSFLSAKFRGCGVIYTNAKPAVTVGQNPNGIKIVQQGGRATVEVDDFYYSLEGGPPTNTTGSWQADALNIEQAVALSLRVNGIRMRSSFDRTGKGAYGLRLRQVNLFNSTVATVDPLSGSNGTVSSNLVTPGTYPDDFPALGVTDNNADLTNNVSQARIESVANHTVAKEFIWPLSNGTGNTANKQQMLGVFDCGMYVGADNPSTFANASGGSPYEVVAKVRVNDCYASQLTELQAVVADTGAASSFTVYKVIDGVRTSLATTAITRLTTSGSIGVRLLLQGNSIVADYYSNGTVPTTIATSGANTLTYTLSTSTVAGLASPNDTLTEAQVWGQDGAAGYVGWRWRPTDASAHLINFRHDRFFILSGTIDGLVELGHHKGVGTANGSIGIINGVPSTQLRVEGTLRGRGWNRKAAARHAGTDLSLSTGIANSVEIDPTGWALPPAGAAITVGASPFTYTNADGYREIVSIYSGTVSSVTLTDPTGAATQIAAATGVNVPVPAGSSLVVTYSVAPTMRKDPIPS